MRFNSRPNQATGKAEAPTTTRVPKKRPVSMLPFALSPLHHSVKAPISSLVKYPAHQDGHKGGHLRPRVQYGED